MSLALCQGTAQHINLYIYTMFSARRWIIIKKVRLVFADISKAFDRVWHAGILHK